MEKQFWAESWEQGGRKTSFHKRDIHPYILKYLSPDKLKNKKVLVPLSGKSVDLMYFREFAAHVVGVEFVTKAVEQFFEEQQLPFKKFGNTYFAEKLTMINSDFFNVSKEEIGHVDIVYDRACLVALPPHLRHKYIEKIEEILPLGSLQFVNTLEYHPTKPEPPFSIQPEEVKNYYGASHTVKHLENQIVENHGLKRAWGLDYVKEHGFMLFKDKLLHEQKTE